MSIRYTPTLIQLFQTFKESFFMADLEGMKNGEINYIPDRLIADPVVFRGMTDSEVVFIVITSLMIWIPVSVLILMPFGFAIFGVAIGSGLTIGTLILAGKQLTRIKRKQPDGLHIVFFKRQLQRKGLARFGFIDESASWDIRRSSPVERIKVATEEEDSYP
jgi:conjugative transfer region protein (TIGR03750 family)